jgi:hypothetical protein
LNKNYKLKIVNSYHVCALVLSLTLCALSYPDHIYAQSFSLGVSPPLVEMVVQPGKTVTQNYTLINQGITGAIYTSVVPFEPADALGNISLIIPPTTNNQQLITNPWLRWFSLQNPPIYPLPGSFSLKTGESRELTLQIRVPETAEEKDYYASLLFQIAPGQPMIGASGTQIAGTIASNILLTVSSDGKPTKEAEVVDFSTPVKKIYDIRFMVYDAFDKIPFTLKLANTGASLIQPRGEIKIINLFGQETTAFTIAPQNILVGSERQLFLKGNEAKALQEIIWEPKGLACGRYAAKLSLNFGDNGHLSRTIYFWVIPWKLLGGILGAFLVLALVKQIFLRK